MGSTAMLAARSLGLAALQLYSGAPVSRRAAAQVVNTLAL
jgi:hypothetical protein